MPVNEGTEIPVFRGARLSDRQMLKKLDDALNLLGDAPCAFWACEGPKRPRAMCTCIRCYAIREVAMVRAALARRLGVHDE